MVCNRALGEDFALKGFFRPALVSLRGSDKYDQPDLMGFEYRGGSFAVKPEKISPALDRIHRVLLSGIFPV